jgi:hypothetical protein
MHSYEELKDIGCRALNGITGELPTVDTVEEIENAINAELHVDDPEFTVVIHGPDVRIAFKGIGLVIT